MRVAGELLTGLGERSQDDQFTFPAAFPDDHRASRVLLYPGDQEAQLDEAAEEFDDRGLLVVRQSFYFPVQIVGDDETVPFGLVAGGDLGGAVLLRYGGIRSCDRICCHYSLQLGCAWPARKPPVL